MSAEKTKRKAERAAINAEARSVLDRARVDAKTYCLSKAGALPIRIRVLSAMANIAPAGAYLCGQDPCDQHATKGTQ